MTDYSIRLQEIVEEGIIEKKIEEVLKEFYPTYLKAVIKSGIDPKQVEPILVTFLNLVRKQILSPHSFSLYHQASRIPFDYHSFGLSFIRPLLVLSSSTLRGKKELMQMQDQIKKKENVILFSNHQTEIDPYVVALLLENVAKELVEEMIFVAGHRVTTDPLAVPFSLGCNLLCIYSKKHIDYPLEEKEAKLLHNRRTLEKMGELLNQGGACIYVAPSGGRDRLNEEGKIMLASFDPQSVEMFRLMGEKAERKTHFYPMALKTFDLLPPPESVEKILGEKRETKNVPVHVAFGKEIDWKEMSFSEITDKKEKRKLQADKIWQKMTFLYKEIEERK